MQNIYSFWKRMLVVCGVAFLSMSVVSCAEDYDDTALWGAVENLEQRVSALEKQMNEQVNNLSVIASLQEALTKLQGDVAANAEDIAELVQNLGGVNTSLENINTIIEQLQNKDITLEQAIGKLGMGIISYTFNEETGMYDIVLSDGQMISVMADCDAIELIEVKKGSDGNLYWSVDGEFLTDEEGNNIPVYKAPEVRINTQTKEYEVSFDGTNWTGLGLFMSENGGTTTEKPGPGGLFTSVEVDDQYAYFTMLDGTEFKVALVTETAMAPSMDVKFGTNKVFFTAGETKTVALTMKNVEKTIIVKPEGWKAVLAKDLKSMTITAPAEGVGETAGFIQLFTVANDGKAAITELKVEVGEPNLTVAIADDGTYTITVSEKAQAGIETGEWGGYTMYATPMYDGMTIEEVYNEMALNFSPWWGSAYSESYEGTFGELEPGVTYLVIAAEIVVDPDTYSQVVAPFEDAYYTTKAAAFYSVEITGTTISDLNIEVKSAGLPEGLYAIPTYFSDEWGSIEEEIENAVGQASWDYFQPLEDGNYTGTWKGLFNLVNGYNNNCQQGTNYAVILLPVHNPTAEAAKYAVSKVKDIVLGETTADVTITDIVVDMTTINALITPNADCEQFRYKFYDEAQYAALATDEDKLESLLDSYGQCFEADEAYKGSLQPGQKMYLLVLVADADGNAKIVEQIITTTALQYNETESVSVSVVEGTITLDQATIKVTPSAGVKSLKYIAVSDTSFNSRYGSWNGDPTNADTILGLGTNRDIKSVALNENGEYVISGFEMFTVMHIFVAGVDENGKTTHAAYVTVDTKMLVADNWGGTPEITVNDVLYWFDENYWSFDSEMADFQSVSSSFASVDEMNGQRGFVKLDVDWGEHTPKTVWLWHGFASDLNEGDDMGNVMTIIKKRGASYYAETIQYEISQGLCYLREADYGMDPETGESGTVYGPQTLYMCFQDEAGKYYALTTVQIDDFVGGAEAETETINFVPSPDFIAIEDWYEDGTEYMLQFGSGGNAEEGPESFVTIDLLLKEAYKYEGTFTAEDMVLNQCYYATADGSVNSLFTDDATLTLTCTDKTNFIFDMTGSVTLANGKKLNISYSGYLPFY